MKNVEDVGLFAAFAAMFCFVLAIALLFAGAATRSEALFIAGVVVGLVECALALVFFVCPYLCFRA